LAAEFLPAKSSDPKLETFFDQWVYGTGIPQLKMTWGLKGKAPALRVVGTVKEKESPVSTRAAFVVEDGRRGVEA